MPERVQNILNRIRDWWNHFTRRQKIILVGVVAVFITTLAILGFVVSRPTYVPLVTCNNATEAQSVKTLLEDNSIPYQVTSDGMTFSVEEKNEADASILLGSNEIATEGYSIEKVFEGGFSSTESDKTKKYQAYLEDKFAKQLTVLSNVKSASVSLSIPEDDGTIIQRDKDSYASIILTLDGEMAEDQAMGIAQFVATEIGNDDTKSILILDSDGNVLFSGGDESSSIGTASTQLSLQQKTESLVKSEVRDVMLGTDVYDNVEVGLNLVMDFDTSKYVNHHYYVDEGQTQGYLDSQSTYESESTGGVSGTPGTDSNDDTSYTLEDENVTKSSVTETNSDYVPSEEITEKESNGGSVNYESSSISVVATSYVIYDEDTLKASGALDSMTFDEYIAANSERVKTEVDEDLYAMISNATGISTENISIIAYDSPVFKRSTSSGRELTDYLMLVLAVLIFGLLGFVVFRSTRKVETEEVEPELSVENLLEATRDNEEESLEDIGYTEKSETRVLIENFVQENPEAAASLLRNWLNEEWE
ncbi:MAG: flagellar biosynthesis protein [Lachnospiraceae bacterium]|nr:flagellar biosynthesis protein [Lachnospiraceae bacterium]